MRLLDYIRTRITSIVKQYNQIDRNARLHGTTYCSGATVLGNVNAAEGCRIFQAHLEGLIDIGRYTSIWGPGIHIIGRVNGISIGNFCSIARYVSCQEDYHNSARTTTYILERNVPGITPTGNTMVSKGKIAIGHDVWVGANAQILSGVTIGHGAVIGAGAVVTGDVPPYAIVVGNPARISRFRFQPDTIDRLLALEWWNWPTEEIVAKSDFLLAEQE